MSEETICKFNKFGHCRFGSTCHKQHVIEKCDKKDCELRLCQLRHPAPCRYFSQYGRCKFGDFCSYDHIEKETDTDCIDGMEALKKELGFFKNHIKDIENTLKE